MKYQLFFRLFMFFSIFVVVAFWELKAPKRRLTVSKRGRWFNNLGIIFLDSLTMRLLLPGAAVLVAAAAGQYQWGLLNHFKVPFPLAVLATIVVLDLIIYLQHLMFHAVPLLWRLHMVHHADLDIDVTTGLRFHPIEILISMFIKMGSVAALGSPVAGVVLFEIILNGTAMFNHGNIRLPEKADKILRLFIVTPDMHRVHHSVLIRETNSNFGFNYPWWDRICGTYRPQPILGHEKMRIGLSHYRQPERLSLGHLLVMPFVGNPGAYSFNKIGADPEALIRQRKRGMNDEQDRKES